MKNNSIKTAYNIEDTMMKHIQVTGIKNIKNKIRSLSINEDLIEFLENLCSGIKETDIRILVLHYVKKIISQTERPVDQDHYRAFQIEYDQDKIHFNPEAWINAELEFLKALNYLNRQQQQSASAETVNNLNSPVPLLRHNGLQKLYQWSRSSLNRRIANGLPFHTDSNGAKFFDVNEVNEWIKENSSLMN
jgi:hypothetical protein